MPDDTQLAFLAGDLNAVPPSAERAGRHEAFITDVNRTIREAADAVLTLDASPLSFEALKARSEPR